jgi:hypothetical protein
VGFGSTQIPLVPTVVTGDIPGLVKLEAPRPKPIFLNLDLTEAPLINSHRGFRFYSWNQTIHITMI